MADAIQDAPADAVTTDPAVTQMEKPVEKPGSESLLTKSDDTAAIAPIDWPEDWRAKMAGSDAKELKRLARFKSPADVYASNRELERKMSSGQVAKLADDATADQIAAWRKDNGIPDKPEGYLENLTSGLVIGDDDKPAVGSFLTAMHSKNVAPDVVSEALDWYYKSQESAVTAQSQADKEFRAKSEDALRGEWGGEYRGNINAIKAFLDVAPTVDDGIPLSNLLMGARLADGTAFGDNPAVLKWLSRLATDANPAGFVSPGVGGSQAQSVTDEIESIKLKMRQDRPAYDKDAKLQARFLQLIQAQEKLTARGG